MLQPTPIYIHDFDKGELTTNSCVPITAWDKFARISLQSVPPVPLPEPTISIDFRPVYMDNIAVQELGVVHIQNLIMRLLELSLLWIARSTPIRLLALMSTLYHVGTSSRSNPVSDLWSGL